MNFFRYFSSLFSDLFKTAAASPEAPRIEGEDWPPLPLKFPDVFQLTKNFHIDEFACNDGTPVPKELYGNVLELAENLQVLRDALGVPLIFVDGYRTKSYNKSIGGADVSQHLVAKAADIIAAPHRLHLGNDIDALIHAEKMAAGGIGYNTTFTHYDTRGTNYRWAILHKGV